MKKKDFYLIDNVMIFIMKTQSRITFYMKNNVKDTSDIINNKKFPV